MKLNILTILLLAWWGISGFRFVSSNLFIFWSSPVTSAIFAQAYLDTQVVQEAAQGEMTTVVAAFLADPMQPLDQKAAAINALGWEIGGKQNCQHYCRLIYNKSSTDLLQANLSADELVCIGYLLLMDHYLEPVLALPYLQKAVTLRPNSQTAAILLALARFQQVIEAPQHRCSYWLQYQNILNNPQLNQDKLRKEALDIICQSLEHYRSGCDSTTR
jgi:hypothetical protein